MTTWTEQSRIDQLDQQQVVSDADEAFFGDPPGGFAKIAQSFTPGVTADLAKITIQLGKYGSPTDNVLMEICANNAGEPGTVLDTVVLNGSTLSDYPDAVLTSFNFTNGPSLQAGSVYWIVLSRSSTLDSGDDYFIKKSFDNDYANGEFFVFGSGTWSSNYGDLYFMQYSSMSDTWTNQSINSSTWSEQNITLV